MKDGPHIARVAHLIGDNTRAEVLATLMSGQALTATELTDIAGVTKATISAHLTKLVEAGLLAVASQGRHRYFRLADDDIARMLESLMGVAYRTGAVRLRSSPREPALRKARVCYDHLAGELGVLAFDTLRQRGFLVGEGTALALGPGGAEWFARCGIDASPHTSRRPPCRPCLDWGERRHHLAGGLGAALLQRLFALRWARRIPDSRVVHFSAHGERQFLERLRHG